MGPRPGPGRVLMVHHQHTGGGICIPLDVRVLLDAAISDMVHYPFTRSRAKDSQRLVKQPP